MTIIGECSLDVLLIVNSHFEISEILCSLVVEFLFFLRVREMKMCSVALTSNVFLRSMF